MKRQNSIVAIQTLGQRRRPTNVGRRVRWDWAVWACCLWQATMVGAKGDDASWNLEPQRTALYERMAVTAASNSGAESTDEDRSGAAPSAPKRPYFDPSRQYFFVPPERTGGPNPGTETGSKTNKERPLDEQSGQQAASLFALARQALDADQGQLAYRLAHEVLQFDPDHEDARRWLGMTGPRSAELEIIDIRPGRRAHPRYGWPAGTYRLITTPHFHISTNDHEATALKLARTLEELRVVWEQLYFDCWGNVDVLRARDHGPSTRRRTRPRHQVVMFQRREEYVQHVQTLERQAELTRGYYHAPSRTAYFIGGDDPAESTWRHEATHQLFHENTPSTRQVGRDANFWIVEGVALYMESLQRCRQWMTVGGLEAERLQYARFRALREGFYIPLENLAALDQQSLQRDDRIRQLYSQAAGLTHFLFDGQQGRHRPALIQYLQQVYQGRDQKDSLSRLTDTHWEDLDRQYHEYLHVNDEQLQWLDPAARIRQLCLGGTSVSDRGLLSLPTLEHATWLDLYGLSLTDRGTAPLAGAHKLEQLNLERTQVSDPTVARLQHAKRLKQLDLSGTQITDAALATVAGLVELEALWLTGTQVSDEGLRQLSGLSHLQTLELLETATTANGRATLRRALPHLRDE